MHPRSQIDVSSAAARRRFFLDRALRLNTRGSGSDMGRLMEMPRTTNGVDRMVEAIFGDVPVFLVGAFAAAAYAPERYTKDVEYFVAAGRYEDAQARLRAGEWKQTRTLTFPNAALGLHGSAWIPRGGGQEIDLITSEQPWAREAFASAVVRDANGERVIPLAYLVLMKLDSSRAIDQADLARVLGRLSPEHVEDVIRTVERHYHDPSAADDVRQYHEIGKWEYETESSSEVD
jgi:hypothetical protein